MMSTRQVENRPNLLISLSKLAGITLTLLTLLAFASTLNWRFAMLAHLRPHFALGFVAVLVVLTFGRMYRLAFLFVLPLIANLSFFVPLGFGDGTRLTPDPVLSITHINLDYDKVGALNLVAAMRSDVIFLQELTPTVADEIAERMPNYRVAAELPVWTTHGSAMLVREDWEGEVISTDFIYFPGDQTRPLLETTIQVANQPIAILNLHVIRPRDTGTNRVLEASFDDVINWVQQAQVAEKEVIVIGDFNSTPWSHPFQNLLTKASLKNAQQGYGLRSTWPAALPNFLRLPIDHAVHSAGLHIVDHQIGRNVHSDHLPLTVTFSLTQ